MREMREISVGMRGMLVEMRKKVENRVTMQGMKV